MEFTHDQLIDTALNLAGYVAAALFSLVVYSAYFGRKLSNLEDAVRCAAGWTDSPGFNEIGNLRSAESDLGGAHELARRKSQMNSEAGDGAEGYGDTKSPESKRHEAKRHEAKSSEATRPEFVDFRDNCRGQGQSQLGEDYQGKAERFARNRGEVILLARKMLEAGNPVERVTDLLPISESEMRLVQMGVQTGSAAGPVEAHR